MIQVRSSLEFIRKRPEMFLDMTLELDVEIALSLLATAMHQGVRSLTIQKHGDLRAIGADADWLCRHEDSPPFVFDRLVPLAGVQNSFRGEVLLTALAPFYAVVEDGSVLYKSSSAIEDARLLEVGGRAGLFSVIIGATTIEQAESDS
ncbi:MAG: hypothetical protein ACREP7_12235 [Lysobacter sp.]